VELLEAAELTSSRDDAAGFFSGASGSHDLVILLHAYSRGPRHLRSVRNAIAQLLPDADIYVPTMPTGLFSFADPNAIAQDLLEAVDCLDAKRKYRNIMLVGHSLGALLARKLYVLAWGVNADAPFEAGICAGQPKSWVTHVNRIILLAGMNRGWSISNNSSLLRAILWTLGSWFALVLAARRGREPLILSIHAGASFITQLRIQWLSMLRWKKEKWEQAQGAGVPRLADTIQLLGSIDDMVSPNDNIDLITTGGEFIYLDVPDTGHDTVVNLDPRHPRYEIFKKAVMTEPAAELRGHTLQPGDYQVVRNEDVKNVIFVMHGIRDEGFWTHKIARKTMTKWQQAPATFASVTSSYGYFAFLPFLRPGGRREKVHWLMDQYVEALARYPKADFYYVGHSNGTYLLARGLLDNPSCHFQRVVFAGSVVRTDFDWTSLQMSRVTANGKTVQPQVKDVLNYVATADWVVAIFPKALELLNLEDLGSAGHDGFKQIPRPAHGAQVTYVHGGHSAAIAEERWDEIADFLVNGTKPTSPLDIDPSQSKLVRLLGKGAPVVQLFIVAGVIALGWLVMWPFGNGFCRGVSVAVYAWVVLKILTSF
jgi:pimeloyl-ACP methyl ester carboxylesterase